MRQLIAEPLPLGRERRVYEALRTL
jgi:hypothetical protein